MFFSALRLYLLVHVYKYTQQKSSAQVGVRVNSALTRYDCIKCILLFKEIILQELDLFQTEIQGSLTKLCAFKASPLKSGKIANNVTWS